jgi:hypothetical protein
MGVGMRDGEIGRYMGWEMIGVAYMNLQPTAFQDATLRVLYCYGFMRD